MSDRAESLQKVLSEDDLLDEDLRYEVIDGVIYMMATPNPYHQDILGEIQVQFRTYLRDKPCKSYEAPFELNPTNLLAELGDEKTLAGLKDKKEQKFEPDISVICDPTKFDGRAYKGVPALVIEVASPSTVSRDFGRKKEVYEKIGIKEYWIVADHHNVYVCLLINGKYEEKLYSIEKGSLTVPVTSFPDLQIIFDEAEITKFASWYWS